MVIGGSGENGELVPQNVDTATKHGLEVVTILLLLMEDHPALAIVLKPKVSFDQIIDTYICFILY